MSERDDNLRKAAILVKSLDARTAERLLGQMKPEEVAQVRKAIEQLGPVGADERERIISEFMHTGSAPVDPPSNGVEMDRSLAERIATFQDPPPCVESRRAESSRFAFLQDASTDRVAEFLAREHPQTVSIVLAHLPPRRAASVLGRFSADLQTEVLGRLVRLDETDARVLGEVERELERLVACQDDAPEERPAGLVAVEAILDAAAKHDRQMLLTRLEQHDQQVVLQLGYPPQRPGHSAATKITVRRRCDPSRQADSAEGTSSPQETAQTASETRLADRHPCSIEADRTGGSPAGSEWGADSPSPIDFNDLIALEDVALAKVFRAADPQVTLLALTGASRQLVDRILGRLPIREAKTLRRQMEQLGPTRLSDMERAQQRLAELAGQLADQGEIIIPKIGRFTMAV
ncbi:MAG: hypothetical protein H8E44_45775 [Planctomycetes bacterium]|nr:hypothetical protein [Planctomycetota bacterium]